MTTRNVTIALDEQTARWARVEAARLDVSVSRFIRDLLRERMDASAGYEQAMTEFLQRAPSTMRRAGERYPSREDLHARGDLR